MTEPVVVPSLPHSWRPFGARLVGTIAGVVLVAVVVAAWLAFSDRERAGFTPFQRGTLVFLFLLAFACWFALMRSRVTASDAGLVVVNGYRKRTFEWAEVVRIDLRRGAPWATADLSNGSTVSMLGIQGSDGVRARRAVAALRRLVAELGTAG